MLPLLLCCSPYPYQQAATRPDPGPRPSLTAHHRITSSPTPERSMTSEFRADGPGEAVLCTPVAALPWVLVPRRLADYGPPKIHRQENQRATQGPLCDTPCPRDRMSLIGRGTRYLDLTASRPTNLCSSWNSSRNKKVSRLSRPDGRPPTVCRPGEISRSGIPWAVIFLPGPQLVAPGFRSPGQRFVPHLL